MTTRFYCLSILALFLSAIGCGGGSAANNGPFGPAKASPLLAPFADSWTLDLEKTVAAQQAAGAKPVEIEQLRKMHANPQFGPLHPDMTITGDVAVSAGRMSSEYRFFAMHEHDKQVCGKAWHHEDRFDPGDMSKCYVRLMLKDKCLYFTFKTLDGSIDPGDADLLSQPPPEAGSAAKCDADHPPGTDWIEWTTYVFSRVP